MKKIKFLAVMFMALLMGVTSAGALELGDSITTGGELSYTKKADEVFSYEVIRITNDVYSTKSEAILTGLNTLEANLEQYSEDVASMENAKAIYENAKKADEVDPTEETKARLAIAEADYEAAKSYAAQTLTSLKDDLAILVGNVKEIAPYTDLTEVNDNTTEGTIAVDMDGANEDDVYVVWYKTAENESVVDDGILFEIYTKDGAVVPTIPSEDPVITPVTNDTDKKDEQTANPKTGVSMPIILGASVLGLSGLGLAILSKKSLRKSL